MAVLAYHAQKALLNRPAAQLFHELLADILRWRDWLPKPDHWNVLEKAEILDAVVQLNRQFFTTRRGARKQGEVGLAEGEKRELRTA